MLCRITLSRSARSASRLIIPTTNKPLSISSRPSSTIIPSTQSRPNLVVSSRLILSRAYSASAAKKVDELFSDNDEFFAPELTSSSSPTQSATTSSSSTTQPTMTTSPSSNQPSSPSSTTSSPSSTDDTSTFASMKGRINYDTYKALTLKPFQFVNMSEVQKRVLALMPELSGGKTRPTIVEKETEVQTEERLAREKGGRQDLLVKAKTGTGKTIAFLVPAIDARLNKLEDLIHAPGADGEVQPRAIRNQLLREISRSQVGCLIISPTRELASQIATEAAKLCTWNKDLQVQLLVGGESRHLQMRQWRRGRLDIVVATPGRLKDLMSEPEILEAVRKTDMLVLDEADTLLDMGFAKELDYVIGELPKDRQTFLFSATVSPEIAKIAKQSLRKNHTVIDCVPQNESNVHLHIPQFATVLPSAADQIPHVLKLIAHDQIINKKNSKIILFLPTTKQTMFFASICRELGKTLPFRLNVHEIHSKLAQERRSRTSERFRKDKNPSILVTSDVSARGVDYPGVTRVIQVGAPSSPEQYIHRVGRTGRGGKTGGRGDIVLLPFEAGFLDVIDKVPIKQIPIEALTEGTIAPSEDGEVDLSTTQTTISTQQSDEITEGVQQLLPTLDPEAIEEVFMSLLGYYIGKSAELNVRGQDVLQGLKEWTTEGAGMAEAPYVSPGMLAKMGMSEKKSGRYGRDGSRGGGFEKRSFGISRSGFGGEARRSWNERSGGGGGFRDRGFRNRGDRSDGEFSYRDRERDFGAQVESRNGHGSREGFEENRGGGGRMAWDDESRSGGRGGRRSGADLSEGSRRGKSSAPWMGRGRQMR